MKECLTPRVSEILQQEQTETSFHFSSLNLKTAIQVILKR